MRSNLPLMIACVILGSLGVAQDKDVNPVDVPKMIHALASDNPPPRERSGPDLKYPIGYDREKQEPVLNALSQLKAMGPAAFKTLIENWGDERYSLTYSVGINGYMNNATVGKMCKVIVYDQIQPYGIWPKTDDDPRGKPKRPSYPSAFLADAKQAAKWLEDNKDKSLYEIQLLVVDWVIEQESKNPKDFTIQEQRAMKILRAVLLDTKAAIERGNYFMDHYY